MYNPSAQQVSIGNWFSSGKGNLTVRARAGTGKTTTIIECIKGAPEKKILLAAFNKEIAEELKSRVTDPRVKAQTLHSLGNWFVFKNWGKTTIDDKRGLRIAEKAIGIKVDATVIKTVAELVSKAKNIEPFATKDQLVTLAQTFGIVAPDDGTSDSWTSRDIAGAAHVALQLASERDGTIDFDDMLYLPVRNKWIFPLYDLVVIDEAQDMCPVQLSLAMKVCKKKGRIAVVGDDKQAIYGFRGADSGALDRLKHELKAQELGLTTTYRCGKQIVAKAAELVPDFQAAPTAHEGIVDSTNASKIAELAQATDFVLSRTNAPLITICLRILSQGRPAFIRGRDIGATLANIVKKTETDTVVEFLAALELWRRNRMDKLAAEDAPDSAFETVEDQVLTLKALCDGLVKTSEVITRIASLFQNDGNNKAVMLSTVHRAKGLEADRVFIIADTLYLYGKKQGDEEEKNIHYVAVTRARKHLTFATGKVNPTNE